MQPRADTAFSSRVVQIDSQVRPCDVLEQIEQCRATHAVVVEGGKCLGVISAREVVKYAPRRPFGELLPPVPPAAIARDLSLDDAACRLAESNVDAVPVVDEHGIHVGVVTGHSLLAAIIEHQEALARSEAMLHSVLDSAPVVLFALDREGIFTLSEGKGLAALGLLPGEAVGKSAFERYRNNPEVVETISGALRGEESAGVGEIRGRILECRCTPTIGADGEVTGVIGVATDITERRQAERQLRRLLDELAHTGRISTIGEMASGLAHELNQPLAAIVAYVDACQELVESGRMDNQQLTDVLRAVSGQAERAGQIIHRLRKMIKRSQPVRAEMSVNDAVREVTELLESEARQSGVTIDLALSHDLPAIAADFLQVQQVVLNLMRNGLEAMNDVLPDQRRLTIISGQTPTGEIEVAVSDFGHGLTLASANQLFEPFFTTKTNGLGLGLSISRTIVEAHGGRLWITPNSTRGATARFTLPQESGKVSYDSESDRIHR